jgi:hypothetical protein
LKNPGNLDGEIRVEGMAIERLDERRGELTKEKR